MATISYLEYSNRDSKYAHDMYKCGNYDPCGRFCQQAVEKRLKYYIEQFGSPTDIPLLSIHQTVKLYKRVCEIADIPPDKEMRGELYELDSYYFDTNYPQAFNIELTAKTAVEALATMKTMLGLIDGLLAGGEEEPEIFKKL